MSLNKNIYTTFLTQFPILIFNFAASVYVTRVLGVEGKGVFSIFAANIQLLALILGVSLNAGIIYFISSKKLKVQKILGLSVYILAFSTVIGLIIVFVSSGLDNILLAENYESLFFKLYLHFSFVLTIVNTIFIGVFQAYKMYGVINRITIINSFINGLVFILMYYGYMMKVFESEIQNVFLYTLIILLVNFTMWFFVYVKKIKLFPSLKLSYKNDISPFFEYIGIGHLSNIINFFNYRLDIWFISYFNNMEQLGLYSLAVSLSQMLLMITNPISVVLFPYLSEISDRYRKLKLMSFFSRLNVVALLTTSIIAYFIGGWFIPILYGADFVKSVGVFHLMVIAVFFMGITKILTAYIASENLVKYNLYGTIIGFFVTFFLNIVLIPLYGIYGAAITSILTYLSIMLYAVYKIYFINKGSHINLFFIGLSDIKLIKERKIIE